MLIGNPALPELTITVSQLLYGLGISLNVVGAILIIRFYRRRKLEGKKKE